MLKVNSLTLKLSLPPAVVLIGMLLFVIDTSMQLSNNDTRVVAKDRCFRALRRLERHQSR